MNVYIMPNKLKHTEACIKLRRESVENNRVQLRKKRKNERKIENNTCQIVVHHVYLMSVFREWYALLKDTAIRKNVGI